MTIIKKIPLSPHKDERGFCWFPFNDLPQLKNISLLNFHIAEIKPGAIRGDHYHPCHTEYLMLCGSQIRLFVQDFYGVQEEETFLESPDFLFIIPPKIRHIVENVGSETNYYVGFFNGEGEVKSVRGASQV